MCSETLETHQILSPDGAAKTAVGPFIFDPVAAELPDIPQSPSLSTSEPATNSIGTATNVTTKSDDEELICHTEQNPYDGDKSLFENTLMIVRESELGGWGVFAKTQLHWGDHVLLERPIIHSKLSGIYQGFDKLDERSKAVALSLYAFYPAGWTSTTSLQAIWLTNR